MLLLLLLLLFFFFFFFLIVLFDYSIAAAKRKLFKSEERERILRTCIRVLCVLCAKETQIYTFCGDDPQQKKILKKSSPFQHKSSLQKSSPFFFTFLFALEEESFLKVFRPFSLRSVVLFFTLVLLSLFFFGSARRGFFFQQHKRKPRSTLH